MAGTCRPRRVRAAAVQPRAHPADPSRRVRSRAAAARTLAALRDAAAREGAALRIVADDGRRAALAAAVQTAEHQLRRDGERLRELAAGRPRRVAPATTECPATSYPARAERTEPYFPAGISPADTAGGCRRSARPPHRAAGVAGLLTTAADRPADWVHAGPGLQRILLTASVVRRRGGAAQPAARAALGYASSSEPGFSDGACPHLVLRIGLVTQVAVSVRRDPGEVLFPAGPSTQRHAPD